MENYNKKKTKKISPVLVIVCLVIVVAALVAGIIAVAMSNTPGQGKPGETQSEIVGDKIEVSDEATLRSALLSEGKCEIVVAEDIYTSTPIIVKGTKTLTGDSSIIMNLDAVAKKEILTVSKDAQLILDGATIDGNGIASGINVEAGGKLSCLSGEILYGMPYGIQTAGSVEIKDVTIDRTMHTAIYVSTGGELFMSGGKLTNNIYTGIALATKAYAKISGDALVDQSGGSLVYNYGTLDITGGTFSGSYTNAFYNKSELNIVSESKDKPVVICNSDRSAISSVAGTKVTIDGLYVHDVAKYALNLEKNSTGTVKNCVVENAGERAFYVSTSELSIEDTKISGGYRGILNKGGNVTIKNVNISDMTGAGIVTSGETSVTTITDVKIANVGKSGLGITGGTVTVKNLDISNAAGSGINITTEAGKTEIDGAKVSGSGTNGLTITIGTLNAKNMVLDGSKGNGVYMKTAATVNFTDVSVTNSGVHAIGNYGGTFVTKNLVIDKTNNGGIVSKGGSVNCDTTTITNTGSRAVNLLEGCNGTLKTLTIKNAGNTGVYADKGTFTLSDYIIDTTTADGMHLSNSDKMTIENGTIKNAKGNGIYIGKNITVAINDVDILNSGIHGVGNYGGTVTTKNLVIDGTNNGGIVSKGGSISGDTTSISNTGSRAISLQENAKIVMKKLNIKDIKNTGVWIENSIADISNFTIDATKGEAVRTTGLAEANLTDGTINATAKGIYVCSESKATAENVKIYRMEGNTKSLLEVEEKGLLTMRNGKNAEKENSSLDGKGYTGRGVLVNGTFILDGGTITNQNSGGKGAGVSVGATGTFVMNGGSIEKNTTTEDGGGVHVAEGGSFTINNGTIQNNHADLCGGGVSVAGDFTMNGGMIQKNDAVNHGAGVMARETATLTLIGGNIASNVTNGNGGGIYIQSNNFSAMSGVVIEENQAAEGAGVYVNPKNQTNKFAMSGGMISGNTATKNGSGVCVNAGTFEMTGGTVAGNGTESERNNSYGAGVYVASGASFHMNGTDATIEENFSSQPGAGVTVLGAFTMSNGTIKGNNTTGNGAGVLVVKDATFTMSDGTITGNIAGKNGGGIFTQSVNTIITGGSITDNTAKGIVAEEGITEGNGAGVYVHLNGFLTMTGGIVKNNTASVNGGGIYVATTVADAKNTITGVTIEQNTAANGGGLYVNTSKDVTIESITIQKNTATQNGGGIYAYCAKSLDMESGTITANTAVNGGGVYTQYKGIFTLKDGSITGNTATGTTDEAGKGSGVYAGATEKDFTLSGGTISGNGTESERSNSVGAGVYVGSGATFIMNGENAAIKENFSTQPGAGIAVVGTFTMSVGSISGNNTTGNGAGVLVMPDATFTMSNGTVTDNTAGKNGGGIFTQSTNTTIAGGTIEGNKALGIQEGDTVTEGNGAGVYVHSKGILTMTGGTVKKNTAAVNGGGIYLATTVADARNTITGVAIEENTALDGGGLYVNTSKDVTIEGITIQKNTATQNGGGVYAYCAKSLDMESGTITANTAVNGGGVYTEYKGIFTLKDGSITGNTATGTANESGKGSGVYAGATEKNFTLSGGTISGNGTESERSNSVGAGVYVGSGATFIMNGENAAIKENFSTQPGAGIAVAGTITMSAGVVSGNNTTGNGAGVLVMPDATFTMSNGTVTDNTAGKNGGGIFTQSINTTITGGNVTNNTANGTDTDGNGGGVYVHSKGILSMEGGTIKNNTASVNGGGIYIATTVDATNTITGGTIEENTAVNGGGLYINTGKDVTMTGMTIQKNTATQNGGGVYVYSSRNFDMEGGTITSNTAVNGGGVYTDYKGKFTMKDGTITANTATGTDSETGKGSGVFVGANNNKPFTMSGGTILGHGTDAEKNNSLGAVYVDADSVFTMNGANAVIKENYSAQNGAGVTVAGTFNMSNGTIQNNNTTANGAAVYILPTGSVTMSGGTISENTATLWGGAIYQEGALTISGGSIANNESTHTSNALGGAIYMIAGTNLTMNGGSITGNYSAGNGGAIYAAGNNLVTLIAGEISGNSSPKTVQGLFMQNAKATSQVVLHTTFVMGNEIRYNSLTTRGTDNPVLIIKGSSLDYTLNLGFHSSGTVYIQCDSADAATQIYSKISQFKTSWTITQDGSYIKAAK